MTSLFPSQAPPPTLGSLPPAAFNWTSPERRRTAAATITTASAAPSAARRARHVQSRRPVPTPAREHSSSTATAAGEAVASARRRQTASTRPPARIATSTAVAARPVRGVATTETGFRFCLLRLRRAPGMRVGARPRTNGVHRWNGWLKSMLCGVCSSRVYQVCACANDVGGTRCYVVNYQDDEFSYAGFHETPKIGCACLKVNMCAKPYE
jgi:hypothetical protein